MKGEHLLDSKGSVKVVIYNIDSLTLRGKSGHSYTDIIIRCSSNTHGLQFYNGTIIKIHSVTITECGQLNIIPLSFFNIALLYKALVHTQPSIVLLPGIHTTMNIL